MDSCIKHYHNHTKDGKNWCNVQDIFNLSKFSGSKYGGGANEESGLSMLALYKMHKCKEVLIGGDEIPEEYFNSKNDHEMHCNAVDDFGCDIDDYDSEHSTETLSQASQPAKIVQQEKERRSLYGKLMSFSKDMDKITKGDEELCNTLSEILDTVSDKMQKMQADKHNPQK